MGAVLWGCIRWPKYWSFSFSISPSSEYSGLISPKIDWSDFLAVQGTFQESSPAPQFEGINSLVFCLLYGPALRTIRDLWEDHRLDYVDICRQSNVSAFQHTVSVCHRFPAEKQCLLFHGCSHHLQWSWSPRRGNLSLLPHFSLLFAMQQWGWMPWS